MCVSLKQLHLIGKEVPLRSEGSDLTSGVVSLLDLISYHFY